MKIKQSIMVSFVIALLLMIAGTAAAEAPAEEWNKTFDVGIDDSASCVQQTDDGGYILAGNTYSSAMFDALLIKTDKNGDETWNKTFGGGSIDRASCVQQTDDGGYILAGYTGSWSLYEDAWLIRTEHNGNETWNKRFGGSYRDGFSDVQLTSDGGYILAGYTTVYDDEHAWLVKTDKNGTTQWSRTFKSNMMSRATSVQQTDDGGYILVGYTGIFGGHGFESFDTWLIKTDGNGVKTWEKILSIGDSSSVRSVKQTSDGGYIIAGCAEPSEEDSDAWLIKTYANGTQEWNKIFVGALDDTAFSVQQTDDRGYIFAGYTYSFGAGSSDGWLIKTYANGTEQWSMTFGGASFDEVTSVQKTDDGGYILSGSTYLPGEKDAWLIKIAGTNLAPVGDAGGPYSSAEGSEITFDASASYDPDGDALEYRWDFESNGTWTASSTEATATHTWSDDRAGMATVEVSDGELTNASTASVTVTNADPVLGAIIVPTNPYKVNIPVSVNGTFSDPGILDTHTAVWNWGDGTADAGTVIETKGSGTVTGEHSYTTAGTYWVTLNVTDDDGGSANVTSQQYVVVYDPSAGYVTAGGWIQSPAGAYASVPSFAGKGTLKISAKYAKGAALPSMTTEFIISSKTVNMNFRSTSYDWIVINGAYAKYTGSGTINKAGNYGYMVSAVDGGIAGDGIDKFRIKIWDKASGEIVYDNEMGTPDDTEPSNAIGSGSIIIHNIQ